MTRYRFLKKKISILTILLLVANLVFPALFDKCRNDPFIINAYSEMVDSQTDTTSPTEANTPSVTPEPAYRPELSAMPETEASPEVTVSPEPAGMSEPTGAPDPTGTPEPSAMPEPAVMPDPADSPEPTVTPAPSYTPEPTEAPESDSVDYTRDATYNISFTQGYVEVLREAGFYESASVQEAFARIGRGVAYAVSRINAGSGNDRLKIAFAAQDGVQIGYVAAANVRPMNAEEADTYVAENRNSSSFFYQEKPNYPLDELTIIYNEEAEPTPEPYIEPGIGKVQSLGLMGGPQLLSLGEIVTQYNFDLYPEAAAHADIVINLADLQNETFIDISGLVENTDYSVLETSVIINISYLSILTVGTHQLTLNFSGSQQIVIDIAVADTTPSFSVSPATAVFNLREESPHHADLSFTLTTANIVFNGIQGMTEGIGYTFAEDTVTVSKDALGLLAPGTNLLGFFSVVVGGEVDVVAAVAALVHDVKGARHGHVALGQLAAPRAAGLFWF
jgi:hypothetical protein